MQEMIVEKVYRDAAGKPVWKKYRVGPAGYFSVYSQPCCSKAMRWLDAPFCVCSWQSVCPEHGEGHVGSHD